MDTIERARALLEANPETENATLIRQLLEAWEGERETRIEALRETQDLRDQARWDEQRMKFCIENGQAKLTNYEHLPSKARDLLEGMVGLAYRLYA